DRAAAREIVARGPRRQEDERHVTCRLVRPESGGNLEAAEVRQHHVEDDEVEPADPRRVEALAPAPGGGDAEAGEFEVERAEEAHRRVVLDEQQRPLRELLLARTAARYHLEARRPVLLGTLRPPVLPDAERRRSSVHARQGSVRADGRRRAPGGRA